MRLFCLFKIMSAKKRRFLGESDDPAMVWAAVSAIFRFQHVFVAVERFFPVVTPPSDMSLPVFIAKFPLLMVPCRPTFRPCSDLFLACWRPDGAPAVGNAKGQSKKTEQEDRARRVCREVVLFSAEAGLQRAVYRVVVVLNRSNAG